MKSMLDLTKNRYSSQWRADNSSVQWRPSNLGNGEKAEYETRNGAIYDLHADEIWQSDKLVKCTWIVARSGKVMGSGSGQSLDAVKREAEKLVKGLEARGL